MPADKTHIVNVQTGSVSHVLRLFVTHQECAGDHDRFFDRVRLASAAICAQRISRIVVLGEVDKYIYLVSRF